MASDKWAAAKVARQERRASDKEVQARARAKAQEAAEQKEITKLNSEAATRTELINRLVDALGDRSQ